MKFLADRMLGKLAKGLRMLGYDTIYYQGEDAQQMIQLAHQEGRAILTRNTKLKPKKIGDRIIIVMEDNPSLQLVGLVQKGHVFFDKENLFSRCLLCNVLLDEISREEAEGKVPEFIFHQQKIFSRCPQCQKIYWPGSHLGNMQKKIKELFQLQITPLPSSPLLRGEIKRG
jgi:uncharacterized protein with PIN domain